VFHPPVIPASGKSLDHPERGMDFSLFMKYQSFREGPRSSCLFSLFAEGFLLHDGHII